MRPFPSLSPRLIAYGAFGAAAFAASVGYFHFKNPSESSTASTSEGIWLRENLRELDGEIRRLFLRNLGRLFKPTSRPPIDDFVPLADPFILCQMALDGVDIGHFPRPETKLSGTLQPDEIDKFLLKSAWLKTIFLSFFYYMPSIYTEEGLWPSDEDYRFERRLRNSREERKVIESLSQLLLQSELTHEEGRPMTNLQFLRRELPRLLINLVDSYRATNKPIECAEIVAKSDWLSLLASMLTKPLHDEERILSHKILSNMLYAFGHERNELPPHLYELHKPLSTKTPKIDIVLVHGLRGSAFRTWRQKEVPNRKTTLFWPKDWLPVDVNEPIRVIAVDYSSRFFKLNKRNGIGERPVVFICHSLGGLLVKQLLLENEALLSKTVGVLFMATPHLGTPVASQLGPYFIRPSNDVLLLQPKSELNHELSEHFKTAAERIPIIVTTLECKKTAVFGREMMLVPIESGILGKGPVYHLNNNHHYVCKPESKESPAYQIVLNFVNDALEYVKRMQQ
uniref:GPI inositol-deacylase n=1 Tax=Globodera rostochiensis TaxID=31243 RepID=A0A914GRK6_GLORO